MLQLTLENHIKLALKAALKGNAISLVWSFWNMNPFGNIFVIKLVHSLRRSSQFEQCNKYIRNDWRDNPNTRSDLTGK